MERRHRARARVLIYSHDTYGLGHLRRSLAIAGRLASLPRRPATLIVTGSPRAPSFALPPGCDTLKLPSVTKDPGGGYRPRSLALHNDVLVKTRAEVLRAAVRGFRPDLVLVDHSPAGMGGELRPLLEDLASLPRRPRVVLGLRDIVDAADSVRQEWEAAAVWPLLDAAYDKVLVYGDPRVLTTAEELDLPNRLGARLGFTGYLAQAPRPRTVAGSDPAVLVTPGGGGDGQDLLRAIARFLERRKPPLRSVIVTGPLLSSRRRREMHARFRSLPGPVELIEFSGRMDRLIAAASGVISMAGYNTVVEVVAAGVPLLVAPRTTPRREQAIRAERLAPLVDLTWCAPDDADGAIAHLVDRAVRSDPATPPLIDLGGLDRVATELMSLLGEPEVVARVS